MGRLIDADAFENFIKEKYKDGESTDDIKDQMLFDLSYQPTVYDVEKVVAELEKQAEQYRERGFETERKNVKVMVTMADRYYAKQCSYLHASEIVKRGGVDEHT